jgi:hypothetical protein
MFTARFRAVNHALNPKSMGPDSRAKRHSFAPMTLKIAQTDPREGIVITALDRAGSTSRTAAPPFSS